MESLKKELIGKIAYTSIFIILIASFIYFFHLDSILFKILNLEAILQAVKDIFPKLMVLTILFLIFKLISIFVFGYFVGKFMEAFQTRSRIKSIKNLINFFWWVFYLLLSLSILMGDFGTLLASLGLVGLGLTFALQKPILNFVGWITIILKDIYNQNDRIKIGNAVGDVKEIQMMNTILYTILEGTNARSHTIITIPNELVLTQEVENFTKDSNYIMTALKISITYESNIPKAMQILEEIIKNYLRKNINDYRKWGKKKGSLKKIIDSLLLKEPHKHQNSEKNTEPTEFEKEFFPGLRMDLADSSVDLTALFLIPYEKSRISKTDINKEFLERSKKEKDISIAYPHLEIIHHKDKK